MIVGIECNRIKGISEGLIFSNRINTLYEESYLSLSRIIYRIICSSVYTKSIIGTDGSNLLSYLVSEEGDKNSAPSITLIFDISGKTVKYCIMFDPDNKLVFSESVISDESVFIQNHFGEDLSPVNNSFSGKLLFGVIFENKFNEVRNELLNTYISGFEFSDTRFTLSGDYINYLYSETLMKDEELLKKYETILENFFDSSGFKDHVLYFKNTMTGDLIEPITSDKFFGSGFRTISKYLLHYLGAMKNNGTFLCPYISTSVHPKLVNEILRLFVSSGRGIAITTNVINTTNESYLNIKL